MSTTTKWTHEVTDGELQVGDLIVEYRPESSRVWQTPISGAGWSVDRVSGSAPDREWSSKAPGINVIHREGQGRYAWRVVRKGGFAGATAQLKPPEPKPKPTSSMWNGVCPRCGRGTYSGLSSLEHEGGSCPGVRP